MTYEKMTVAELKDLLREAELPVSGKKSVLIERLNESSVEEAVELVEEEFIDHQWLVLDMERLRQFADYIHLDSKKF